MIVRTSFVCAALAVVATALAATTAVAVPARPNFVVGAVTKPPAALTAGDEFRLRVLIANTAADPARPSSTAVLLSRRPAPGPC